MSVDWPRTLVTGVALLGLYAGYRMVTATPRSSPPLTSPTAGGTKHLSDAFFRMVSTTARDLRARGARVTGEDVLAVLLAESEVKPWTGNEWGYAGLNGMGEEQRRALGFRGTVDDWKALSAEQQMPYVRRLFEGNIRDFARGDYSVLFDVGRLYLLNIMPALIRKPDDHVVFSSRSPDPISRERYRVNAIIDVDRKGYVEVADMGRYVAWTVARHPGYWQELRTRLRAVEGVS